MVTIPDFGSPPYGTLGDVQDFCNKNELGLRAFDLANDPWESGWNGLDDDPSRAVAGNHDETPPGSDSDVLEVGGIVGVVVNQPSGTGFATGLVIGFIAGAVVGLVVGLAL